MIPMSLNTLWFVMSTIAAIHTATVTVRLGQLDTDEAGEVFKTHPLRCGAISVITALPIASVINALFAWLGGQWLLLIASSLLMLKAEVGVSAPKRK